MQARARPHTTPGPSGSKRMGATIPNGRLISHECRPEGNRFCVIETGRV
jgi:hypothetical protein